MREQQGKGSDGLMHMVLDGMSPNVKAVLFAFLAVPIFLAISGILLQIIVETMIEDTRQVRKDEHALKMLTATAVKVPEVVEEVGQSRIVELEQLIIWSCTHGRKANRPEFCKMEELKR